MKVVRKFFLIIITGLFFLYLFFWPVAVTPEVWHPEKKPELTGKYAVNNRLKAVTEIGKGAGIGAEDVDLDSQGRIYGSFADGRILRFDPDGSNEIEFANTKGRPLGMEFDPKGNLIIADAKKGLLSLSPQGELTVLSTQTEGNRFGFTDDVDVANDGKIYFSDASDRYNIENYLIDLIEHTPNGKLLVYNPDDNTTKVLLSNLYFANGVAVSPDLSFVLVVETSSYRVKKYWLKGNKQGTSEIIVDNLPGFPDGISSNGKGIFWLAIAYPRNIYLDRFADRPFIRKILLRLPDFLRPKPKNYGFVLGIDENGKVIYNLQDPSPESFSPITSVEEVDGMLYLGSLTYDAIGKIKVPSSK